MICRKTNLFMYDQKEIQPYVSAITKAITENGVIILGKETNLNYSVIYCHACDMYHKMDK